MSEATLYSWEISDDRSAEIDKGTDTDTIRWGRVLAVAAALVLAFSLIEHEPEHFAGSQISDNHNREDNIADDYIDGIEEGSGSRRIVIIAYGLAGVVALGRCRERVWNLRWSGIAFLGGLVLWAMMSALWSDEFGLSAKRLVVAVLMLSGSFGLARALRPDELIAVALTSLLAFVSYSFLADISAGAKPWGSDYRFSGTLHPNIQAAYCGMLCLAAYTFPAGFASKWITRGLFAYGFVLLLLTQSRTSVLALLVGMLMVFVIRLSGNVRTWAILSMVCLLSVVTAVGSSLSAGDRRQVQEVVLLGRTESAGSLTGRVPLWDELSKHAAKRPLQGYGYETFWTPKRIDEVMKSQQWAIQSAHNAYLEVVLQLGFVGLFLAIGVLVTGLNLTQSAYARTEAVGYAFGYGILAFAMTNSLLESHFAKLKYPTVLALVALLGVCFFFPAKAEEEPAAEPLRERFV